MIYFIRGAGQTDVKIGYSANVKGRMVDLQVGMPREVELLLAIPGSQRDEKELHLRFRPFHIRGEWFELTSEIVDYIRDQQARDARPWLAKMPAAWSEPGSHHCDGCDLNYTGADAYEHAKVHQEWLDLCAAHGFIRTYLVLEAAKAAAWDALREASKAGRYDEAALAVGAIARAHFEERVRMCEGTPTSWESFALGYCNPVIADGCPEAWFAWSDSLPQRRFSLPREQKTAQGGRGGDE